MNSAMLRDPLIKKLMRLGWGIILGLHGALNVFLPRSKAVPRVFFGGARAGDVGGPLVKVKRLRVLFPEQLWGFNVVYTLSNTPYLPGFALWLLKLRGVPIVHNQNGVFYPGWYAGDWQRQNKRMARTFHQAEYVFFQSEFCKISAEKYLGIRQGPSEILYNAVDTAVYRPLGNKTASNDRPCRFLLTGKIDDHMYYRVESSLQGLAASKDLNSELVVAGWMSADARKQAEALAAELKIENRVTFTGRYTQEEAPAIYNDADVYIMTKHNDPCPNTVLEAMACGLPVLYSNTGGVGELVGDAGIGLKCEQGWDVPQVPEPVEIGQGMVDIAANLELYSQRARARAVERFDIRDWESRHGEVFTQLLEQS